MLRAILFTSSLLLASTLLSAQDSDHPHAIDPQTVSNAYTTNAVKADLLYKNKSLTFQGVVTAITDVVYFGSPSEEKRLGGPKSLEFFASDSRTTIWLCSFDKNRETEMVQLHRNDTVILEGQLTNLPRLQHCRIRDMITNSPAFQTAPTSTEQIFDLDTLEKAYGENQMRFDLLYKNHTFRVKGIVTDLTNETAWGGSDVYILRVSRT